VCGALPHPHPHPHTHTHTHTHLLLVCEIGSESENLLHKLALTDDARTRLPYSSLLTHRYGISLEGPGEGEARNGIFVKKVKPGPAANSGRVREGMRIIQMNGDDMTQACKADAARHFRSAARVEMVLEPAAPGWTPSRDSPKVSRQIPPQQQRSQQAAQDHQLRAQQSSGFGGSGGGGGYDRGRGGGDEDNTGDGLIRVTFDKHPDYGFGLTLLGPAEVRGRVSRRLTIASPLMLFVVATSPPPPPSSPVAGAATCLILHGLPVRTEAGISHFVSSPPTHSPTWPYSLLTLHSPS
jgi:hypothetical protein